MRGVNKVILIGNLGNDPEHKLFDNGGSITNVSIATTETFKDKEGNKIDKTEWHRVRFSNKLAEIAKEYLRKGSKVYVEGKLTTRKWQDKEGKDHYTTEIVAYEMQMLDRRGQSDNSDMSDPSTINHIMANAMPASNAFNDDIPF